MESYKLAVEMADRISARRAVANAFFLTVNTTLVTVVGLRGEATAALPSIAVCVAGIVVAACWWLLLQNYRRLNEAKFVVINRLEGEHLTVKVFSDEWAELGGKVSPTSGLGGVRAGLKELGGVERLVPVVFGLLYVVLLIGRLVS